MAKKDQSASMDPENPTTEGILHFYQEEHPEKEIDGKKVKLWKFVTAENYEEHKSSLPDLCFASRHPIKELAESLKKIHNSTASNSDWLYSGLPDLQALSAEVTVDSAATEHSSKTSSTNESVQADSPLYYSNSVIDG